MLYLNENDILNLHDEWTEPVKVIKRTNQLVKQGKFHQPIKPYINFDNTNNRIIAMPARLGSDSEGISGIKWIASFPDNINHGLKRANSVTILNSNKTGEITSIINTSAVSVIRTSSVTGFILMDFFNKTHRKGLNVLIIGFGPIGQAHLQMLLNLYSPYINSVKVFDKRNVSKYLFKVKDDRLSLSNNVNYDFQNSDIVITCTTSSAGYLNVKPKKESLLLNVSLRDYSPEMQKYFDTIIVDNWDEVCRAGTDIEKMSKVNGLTRDSVIEMKDLERVSYSNSITFFNPMGMAVFDVAIAELFKNKALSRKIGKNLI